MNKTITIALAVLAVGCTVQQRAVVNDVLDDDGPPATVTEETISTLPGSLTQHVGPQILDGGRLMFPNSAGQICESLYGRLVDGIHVAWSMPCEEVLNVCLPDGSTLMMLAQFACTPAMVTLDQACAEQPEHAAWYGCTDRRTPTP